MIRTPGAERNSGTRSVPGSDPDSIRNGCSGATSRRREPRHLRYPQEGRVRSTLGGRFRGAEGRRAGMREVDVAVVGAGPTGLFAAYYAGFRGLTVALV